VVGLPDPHLICNGRSRLQALALRTADGDEAERSWSFQLIGCRSSELIVAAKHGNLLRTRDQLSPNGLRQLTGIEGREDQRQVGAQSCLDGLTSWRITGAKTCSPGLPSDSLARAVGQAGRS